MNRDKPINDLKRQIKNPPKNQNQTETKNQTEFKVVFLKTFKAKQKYLIWTPLIKSVSMTFLPKLYNLHYF